MNTQNKTVKTSNSNGNLIALVECAIFAALSVVLSLFKIPSPYGGSITFFSMFPVMLFSYRRGVKWGLVAGFLFSVVKLLLGLDNFAWIPTWYGMVLSVFFDYLIAYSAIGLAGTFRKLKLSKNDDGNLLINCIAGILFACIVRFACHLISGAVIWASISGEGEWNTAAAWIYSVSYNGEYMIPETILMLIVSPVMAYLVKIGEKLYPVKK